MADPLGTLVDASVSIWLNARSRERLCSDSWAEQVEPQHGTGMTTHASIVAKAITGGFAYDGRARSSAMGGVRVGKVLQAQTTDDVPWPCDVPRPRVPFVELAGAAREQAR